ncbi:MAG TPA: short chain dehydrogenase, partial [Cystobacter sp.]
QGVAFNALWPRTTIATAAVNMLGGQGMMEASRTPEIMSDAAYAILTRDSRSCTGNFFLDEDLLREQGVKDFDKYLVKPGTQPLPDFFID